MSPSLDAVRDHARLLTAFLRAPVRVGAVAPSSRFLAARMTEGIGLEDAQTVVELGPGTGAFTGAIRECLAKDALFLCVEINPTFAESLQKRFPDVHVVNDSAEHIGEQLAALGRTSADCILSGLPWQGFPRDMQERLLAAVFQALRPGGRFATFAYVQGPLLPLGRFFRARLESRFKSVSKTGIVWRNLPPAFVYRCER